MNSILNRDTIEKDFRNKLEHFEKNKTDLSIKRGFFFYGDSGVGKTEFVKGILKDMNYDIIVFDSNDVRNKGVIESITKFNMNDRTVLSMFSKNPKKIAIFMDEIDSMNNGDKGGLTSLIKVMRAKKTKKQKLEDYSLNPIICVGNYHFDKKITELKKVTNSYEIKKPTYKQINAIVSNIFSNYSNEFRENAIKYIDGDLRKVEYLKKIIEHNDSLLNDNLIKKYFHNKINNEFSKDLTKKLINNKIDLCDHNLIINETDRTSISLLFHENIIDILGKTTSDIEYYERILKNYCIADYLDRVTFQKQIWIFNELTSIIKTIYSNNIYHDTYDIKNKIKDPIRFTKVLTKYSTEYNNKLFINNLCQRTNLDKSELINLFLSKREDFNDEPQDIYNKMKELEITKLEVNRMYRFIDNVYD
tara:strand:+ start:1966 stop:3219 length:1254 start_codon:yes stop_codon:yes gene_type:complete